MRVRCMTSFYAFTSIFVWTGEDGYVNNDRFRVDGDKNMRLLAFAFAIVFVWTGPLSDGANFSFIRWGFNLEIFRFFFQR